MSAFVEVLGGGTSPLLPAREVVDQVFNALLNLEIHFVDEVDGLVRIVCVETRSMVVEVVSQI